MKRAAVINDLSGFGRCSLTAALPVLSVMGIEACPLPTAILTNQTGYDSFFCDDYTDKIDIYTKQWQSMGKSFDGICTGYLGNENQAEKILNFIDKFKTENTLLMVDPVMADYGEIYSTYTPAMCDEMKKLSFKADIITPNFTELCILTDNDYEQILKKKNQKNYLDCIENMAKSLLGKHIKTVVVTGVEHEKEYIYNGIFTQNETVFRKTKAVKGGFSGTGDLFAAVVFGSLLGGKDITYAVSKATEFIERAIRDTVKSPYDRNDGVNFEKYLYMLAERN